MLGSQSSTANEASVCVIGLGYIGLPTAAVIASNDVRVVGVDVDEERIDQINRGEAPFFEPDFETTLAGVVAQGRLSAQVRMPRAESFIIAVPTPFGVGHSIDTTYIEDACSQISAKLTGGELIVLESTSPPGTTEKVAEFILDLRPDLTADSDKPNSIYFAHCPERVLPGRIMAEISTNDRIIGGLTPRGAERARALYAQFCTGQLLVTDAATAELAKLTENAFRDVNIAFANELSLICDRVGIDVRELIKLANHHPRVNILNPGPGVGGHCIAVDPWFIVAAAPEESQLIATARSVNDGKPEWVVDKILGMAAKFKDPIIAALGITFKANVDDLRGSPAVEIVERVATRLPASCIRVVDPKISSLPAQIARYQNVQHETIDGALASADVVVLLVDHADFYEIDPKQLEEKSVLDTRGVWS